jgi:predicted ATPase
MIVRRLKLTNWRNFRNVDIELQPHTFMIGANATGKSNLLDVLRFLRTVAQPEGGGLQKAVKERGGMSKVRSLHARSNPEVAIEIEVVDSVDQVTSSWRYAVAFKSEGAGKQRVAITRETVEVNGKVELERPDKDDKRDAARLTQTHLEQINNNAKFRELVEFLAGTTYLHLVPQLLKHADEISGRILESDPFGQGLLQRIARTTENSRVARLRRISKALNSAVPQFSELRFVKDEASGAPHLEARFSHWRENGAWQREEQFSDGTLRLIGLLWALFEGDGVLLMEEPELSLNDAIVEHIPSMIDRVLRSRKKGVRQVIVTTHSDNLISAVDPESIVLLEHGENGTTARRPTTEEMELMTHGLNGAEVMLPKTRPDHIDRLGLFE